MAVVRGPAPLLCQARSTMPARRPTRCATRHRGQRRSRGGCSTRETLALKEQYVCDHVRRRAALPEPARPPEPAPAHVRLRAPAHAVPCAGGGGQRAGRSRSTSSTRATACAAAPPAPTERARPPETALAHTARLGPPAHVLAYVASGSSWRRIGIVSVFYARSCDTWCAVYLLYFT